MDGGTEAGDGLRGLVAVDVAGQFIHLHYISLRCRFGVSALLPDYHHVVTKDPSGEKWTCERASSENGKSMFHQMETDGQGVTLRPSHLTGTNGCTRLPVQAKPIAIQITSSN